MTITPAFLEDLRSRIRLSDIIGRTVSFDRRKSNPRKGDYWACCPFHGEKTPSFHVDDEKGRYYCFGCHVKGDAVTFLRETQSLSFPEAVAMLADEAGVPMPQPTPQAAAREKARHGLLDVLDAAARFFGAALESPAGGQARAYLERRGLDADCVARFRLGYAPPGGSVLQAALSGAGVPADLMARAGLTGQRDTNRPPYDYFRDRVIFPIADGQGRVIGFGGRVLSPDVEPKYLNSPETDVFKKGEVLYNLHLARKALRQAPSLVIAEGYMDVIAFDRAGLGAAVAPLGTALTEDQLDRVWRLAEEPVLCFDGDTAGLRAAHRALDLALPKLAPGRTLRFAMLPAGQDPDDLLSRGGADALKALLARTIGVADLLWQRELAAGPLDTPERRAGLEARLEAALAPVADRSLLFHMRSDIRQRLRTHLRGLMRGSQSGVPGQSGAPDGRGGTGRPARGRPSWSAPSASRELKRSALAGLSQAAGQADKGQGTVIGVLRDAERLSATREREILGLVLSHPWLLDTEAEELAEIPFADQDCRRLRDMLLTVLEETRLQNDEILEPIMLDSHGLAVHLSQRESASLMARVLDSERVRSSRHCNPETSPDAVKAIWRATLDWHHAMSTCRQELRRVLTAFHQDQTQDQEAKLIAICEQISTLSRRDKSASDSRHDRAGIP